MNHPCRQLLMLLTLGTQLLPAATLFVSSQGDNGNPGTYSEPFRTIQKAVSVLAPGDVCYVRSGRYKETVELTTSGTAGKPIRIQAYPGENVLFDGTDPITSPWTEESPHLWRTSTTMSFEQLFSGEKMCFEARWPNCSLEEVFTRKGWATAGPKSEYRKIRDPELAKTNIDWNGATAILNVAHQFWSWSRPVEGYVRGSDILPYMITMNPYHTENRNWWHDDFYYLMGKKEALDANGEWYLDENGTLTMFSHSKPENIRVKQRDYAFSGDGLKFVEISGFSFFGCSFRFSNAEDCTISYCNLLYPAYARGVPNAEEKERRKPCPGTQITGKRNTICSCSFQYCPNYGVVFSGENNVIENSLIHDVNWTGTLHYTAVRLVGMKGIAAPKNVARKNTLYNVGNTILSCSGPESIVEFNHVHHGGLISSDVSLLYTCMPAAMGIEMRYNWVHDSLSPNHSLGIRGDDKTRGLHVHHNVIWNVAKNGIVTKGGRNRVYNNTCFANGASDIFFNSGPERDKWWQEHVKAYQEQNEDSLLINNCAQAIVSTTRATQPQLPGDNSNNFTGNDPKLMDPANLDFRPATGSPLIDAGRAVEDITAPFAGEAPDIGAYEYGGEHWLPGHHNGIWLAQEKPGSCRVRLNLPILSNVTVKVQSAGIQLDSLSFTPETWSLWQPIEIGTQTAQDFRFSTSEWGMAEITASQCRNSPLDVRAEFAKPDLTSAKTVDSSPKYDYEASYTSTPTAKAAFRAYFTDRAPDIDGTLNKDEWPGWTDGTAIPLDSLGKLAPTLPPAGEGYALFDAETLFLAVKVGAGGAPPLAEGGSWGPQGTGGIEVDLAARVRRKMGDVAVLHGYPSGKLESVTDAGAHAEFAEQFDKQTVYKTRIHADGTWTCEMAIPLSVFGNDLSDIEYLYFNLGLRLNGAAGGPWFAAVRTGSANWDLAAGAVLYCDMDVPATPENLLTNGGFETENVSPWGLSTNLPQPPPEGVIERVHDGRRNDWCIRLQCDDKEVMRQRVFKWVHPISDIVQAPGRYCLTYDVRIVGKRLVPRDTMGSFNSYLHISRNGKPGGNLAQRPAMIENTGDRWIRRDFVIEVPEEVEPSMVSLQLHRATGTVLIDNVRLTRCIDRNKEAENERK